MTRKVEQYQWTAECEVAFKTLKGKLLTPPVFLAYPDFSKDFIMETNVNRHGFSVIMSQLQEDNKLHPVAYASQSVSVAEVNYIITNLETLTVVWAITHFKYYVYGQNMTVVTDHVGVKVVLGVPNLTGKQARW